MWGSSLEIESYHRQEKMLEGWPSNGRGKEDDGTRQVALTIAVTVGHVKRTYSEAPGTSLRLCLAFWPNVWSLHPREFHRFGPLMFSNAWGSLSASGPHSFPSSTKTAALCLRPSWIKYLWIQKEHTLLPLFIQDKRSDPSTGVRRLLTSILVFLSIQPTSLKPHSLAMEETHKANLNPIHRRPRAHYQNRRDTMGSI